jgi:hypothetical protein|eukprot:5724-Heterococcus_DN1.PRE.1
MASCASAACVLKSLRKFLWSTTCPLLAFALPAAAAAAAAAAALAPLLLLTGARAGYEGGGVRDAVATFRPCLHAVDSQQG